MQGLSGLNMYCASKAAIWCIVRGMAIELASERIRVNPLKAIRKTSSDLKVPLSASSGILMDLSEMDSLFQLCPPLEGAERPHKGESCAPFS